MKTPRQFVWGLLFWISLLIVWEVAVRTRLVSPVVLPAPTEVAPVAVTILPQAVLASVYTLWRLSIGFVLGVVAGVMAGVMTAEWPLADRTVGRFVHALFPIPTITFIGLFIFWFGATDKAILILTAVAVFFAMYINVYEGSKAIDPRLVEVFKNLGGISSWQQLKMVTLPGIMPSLLSGLRYAIGRSISTVIVGEFLLGRSGLGYLASRAVNEFRPERIIIYQAIIAIIALLMYFVFDKWQQKQFPWIFQAKEDRYAAGRSTN